MAAPLIGELKVLRGDASEVNDGKIHGTARQSARFRRLAGAGGMRDLLAAVVLFCAQYDKGNYPAVTAFSGFQKKYPDVVRRRFPCLAAASRPVRDILPSRPDATTAEWGGGCDRAQGQTKPTQWTHLR